jgi:hypothetical protein
MSAEGGRPLLDLPPVAPVTLHHDVGDHPHINILHEATDACDDRVGQKAIECKYYLFFGWMSLTYI